MIERLRALDPLEVGIAFNAATSLFALPLYLRLYASPGAVEILRLALVVQVLPTLFFAAVAVALPDPHGMRFVRRVYRIGLTVAGLASIGRLIQLQIALGLPAVPTAAKVAVPLFVVALVLALAALRADWLSRGFGRVAPVFVLVSVLFVAELALSGLPQSIRATPSQTRDDSVFVFVFDELGRDVLMRDGQIDVARFPTFAALEREGITIGDATSNYSDTCQSIPSMLTGRSLPVGYCNEFFLVGKQENLLTALGSSYELHVYGEYLRDCTDQAALVCRGIPHFVTTTPQLAILHHLIPPGVRVGLIGDALGETFGTYTWTLWQELRDDVAANGTRGRAYFVHLLLPHAPYIYDANGALHHSPYDDFRGIEDDALAYRNYEQQVMFVDHLLGDFIEQLRARDAYRTATIVVTGDHGPRPVVPPQRSLEGVSAQTPDVPLIIKGPRLSTRRVFVDYQHIDFAPTVLDAVGVETALAFEGRSALRDGGVARRKWFFSDGRTYERDGAGRWKTD